MASEQRTVRSEATRKEVQEKIKKALASKPTGNSLLQQAVPFDKLLKATGSKTSATGRTSSISPVLRQSIVKINKGKRRYSRPTSEHRQRMSSYAHCLHSHVLRLPSYSLMETPEWFKTQGKPDVSVIIPLYKSSEEIRQQIASWETDGLNVEIVYVDDACPAATKNQIVGMWQKKGTRPVGKIVACAENCGYGRACNVGAKNATADKLVFLNADTTVTPGWLLPLMELLEDKTVGVVGNTQLKLGGEHHGSVDSFGSQWDWGQRTFLHIGRHIHNGRHLAQPMQPTNVPADLKIDGEREMVTGCCVALRKDVFDSIDGFDPRYEKGYWEDSEMCCLLRERGFKVMFTPRSVIWHKQGHSGAGGDIRAQNNMHYFNNRWVNNGRLDTLVQTPRPSKALVTSILVKRMAAHGDVIMATGVLPGLKKKHPQAFIDFWTAVPSVLHNNPYVRKVVNQEAQIEKHYDLIVNLDNAYEYHPDWHMRDCYADAAGIPSKECVPMVVAIEPGVRLPLKYAVLHSKKQIDGDWVGRSWPEENYLEIATRLRNDGYQIVLVGGTNDVAVPCDFDLRGQTTINQLSWVMKNASLFIGMDSMPMHLAMIHNTPGVAFFGCILPEKRLTGSSLVPVNAHWLDCIGCHHKQTPPIHGTTNCVRGDRACQSTVTVDQMWDAILKATKKKQYRLTVIT